MFDPRAYRLLLITPEVYRAWAKLRLRHLQGRISGWVLPNMFGGVQGIGADEAWYSTAVDVELAITQGTPHVGGALDLYKCFDQVLRPLLYAVLRLAGLPDPILVAYVNYQEQMVIYLAFLVFLIPFLWHYWTTSQTPCGHPTGLSFLHDFHWFTSQTLDGPGR